MPYYTDKYYMDGDIVRWISNDSIPFEDMLEEMLKDGVITPLQFAKSKVKRECETADTIARYRKQMENYVPSDEEMFEMQSAFGEGVTVVNIITGQEIKL